jgi:hypothetical protein
LLQNDGGGRDARTVAAPVKKKTRSISSNSSRSSGGNTSGFGRLYYLNANSVNVTVVFFEDMSTFVLLPKLQTNYMLLHVLVLPTGKTTGL